MLRTRARYVSFAAIELDFVVVGFQKCGTTTMRALLGACSDVMLLDCSDVFDFTSLLPTAHGAATVAVARKMAGRRKLGCFQENMAREQPYKMERLYLHFPKTKFVLMVRNQIDAYAQLFA